MQENEAPEKIFLEWYRIGDKKYRDWCIIPKTKDEPVEYVRTDSFIEKACEFLKDRIEHDSIDYPMATNHLIEDFKKYMKGE